MSGAQRKIYWRLLRRFLSDNPPTEERIRGELVRCGVRRKAFQAHALLVGKLVDLHAEIEPYSEILGPLFRRRRQLEFEIQQQMAVQPSEVIGGSYCSGPRLERLYPGERDALVAWRAAVMRQISEDVHDFVGRAAARRSEQPSA